MNFLNEQELYNLTDGVIEEQAKGTISLFNGLNEIKIEAKKWIEKENLYKNQLKTMATSILRQHPNSRQTWEKVYDKLGLSKSLTNYNNNFKDFLEHYKKGYELVHKIREYFTKQEIKYTLLINVGTETAPIYHEMTVSLEMILNYTSVVKVGAKGKIKTVSLEDEKIRLDVNKKAIEELTRTFINANLVDLNNENDEISVDTLEKKELWDDLVTRYYNSSFNKGRIYEVYRVFRTVEKYQSISRINKNQEKLADAIAGNVALKHFQQDEKNKKNAQENIRGWQKGDLGLTQLKSLLSGNTKLMDSSQIKNVLKDVIIALEKPNQKEMSEALKKIYTVQGNEKEKLKNKIDKGVNKQAEKNIEKMIKELFDTK